FRSLPGFRAVARLYAMLDECLVERGTHLFLRGVDDRAWRCLDNPLKNRRADLLALCPLGILEPVLPGAGKIVGLLLIDDAAIEEFLHMGIRLGKLLSLPGLFRSLGLFLFSVAQFGCRNALVLFLFLPRLQSIALALGLGLPSFLGDAVDRGLQPADLHQVRVELLGLLTVEIFLPLRLGVDEGCRPH